MLNVKSHPEFLGWIYGFIGVVIFSLTLPATRLAVSELDPVFVGGVIIGFPLLSAIAMRHASASHGAVIIIQLIQPFLTILASAVLLNELLTLTTLGFAGGVIICVALGKRV